MKVKVIIRETLERIVEVEVEHKEDALPKVTNMYRNSEIVLSADDFLDYEMEIVGEEKLHVS